MASIERILITGADGFVGRWLVEGLGQQMPDAHIIGASSAAPVMEGVEGRACDVTDRAATDALIAGSRPDAVVHLAALSSVTQAQDAPLETWNVNLTGTLNLADAVLAHVPQARFLFAGSSESYGATFARWPGPLDEDAPLSPNNPYAASKAAADLAVGALAASEGLHAVRFRPFNHTGPGQDERFVIPAFASQIARIEGGRQEPVMQVGDLRARREFLDVRDIVNAYIAALTRPEPLPDGTVLNLATGNPIPVGDMLNQLIAMSQQEIAVKVDPERVRGEETPFAGGDARRAADLLGWTPIFSLRKTLESVLTYWRKSTAVS